MAKEDKKKDKNLIDQLTRSVDWSESTSKLLQARLDEWERTGKQPAKHNPLTSEGLAACITPNEIDGYDVIVPPGIREAVDALRRSCKKPSTNDKCCLYYSNQSTNSVMTKEGAGSYACRGCTRARRPCLVFDTGREKMVLLPIHPTLRDRKKVKRSTQDEYWVSFP